MSVISKFPFQKKDTFACDNYILPKTRANKNKQWTLYSALKILLLHFFTSSLIEHSRKQKKVNWSGYHHRQFFLTSFCGVGFKTILGDQNENQKDRVCEKANDEKRYQKIMKNSGHTMYTCLVLSWLSKTVLTL